MRLCLFSIGLLLTMACQRPEITNQRALFEEVWSNFAETYPYFSHKGIEWDSIYDVYEPRFEAELKPEGDFDLLEQMLGSLKDIHVNLQGDNREFAYSKRHFYPSNPADFAHNYLGEIYYDNNRVIYAQIAQREIAYIRIKTFEGSVNNYVNFPTETIITSLESQKGLIIDLRDNPGGKEDFATDFASRFMSEARVYKHVRFRDGPSSDDFGDWQAVEIGSSRPISVDYPIVLLTNRGCYSATESFVLMMKTLPQVQIVGDTTGGGTGNPSVFYTDNGWRYTMPSRQSADLAYRLIEDNGVSPDISLSMTEEEMGEERDVILERGIGVF